MKTIVFFLLTLSLSYGFVYELKAKNTYSQDIDFARFEDRMLVIFVSSNDMKTSNKLKKLNNLYHTYKEEGISFVGFPIKDLPIYNNDFCVLNYGVDFNMIGEINNDLAKIKKYINHIYENEEIELYAPILIYDRKVLRFSNIYELKDKLMKIFDYK